MARVAPVRLQYNPKSLWFDPGDLEIKKDDAVVVKTARGLEFGHAADEIMEVTDAEIKDLKSELKPVVRLATDDDKEKADELHKKSLESLPVFKEMALEANESMHPVSVEYLFEGDKAIFYFEAEERIDFRELVRKLASHFKVRVDMRQIGVRDEARMVGGIGHCGQELCCKRLGGEFNPVSIRMAKEQDLSLNPQKISGVCGRLMCCLRYEYDAYKDFKSRAPKMNASIDVPGGTAKVSNLDVPREVITLRLEDNKTIKIPLSEMIATKEGERPNKVSEEVFELYSAPTMISDSVAGILFDTSRLTGKEKLSDGSARSIRGKDAEAPDKKANQKRKSRKRRTHVGSDDQAEQSSSKTDKKRTPRKRRSNSGEKNSSDQNANKAGSNNNNKQNKSGSTQRPGQKSSGLRAGARSSGGGQKKAAAPRKEAGTQTEARKPRRRSHKASGSDVQE